jgi:carboxypeptidase C (cathepsin A)
MRRLVLAVALASALVSTATLAHEDKHDDAKSKEKSPDAALVKPLSSETEGSVTVEGKRVDYRAVAGTLVLHGSGDKEHEPTVSMFYTAYFKKGVQAGQRPITFIYNGGPGSATVWLHMGRPSVVPATATRPPRPMAWSTTTTACSTRPTSFSSTPPAPASAA